MDYAQAVRLAQEGKETGFNFLYEETYKSKFYLALKYMKNEEAAQDVLQDAYIKAFSKLDTLEKPEAFPGWLGIIVANTAKNALQKQNPILFTDIAVDSEEESFEYEIADESVQNQPEAAYTQQETQELVHELLDSLPDEQRMCILMFHIEERSIREIASALNCSENTVKSRLNYGRKNLKAKAEELQRKGYKLYNVAPIPMLLYLLRSEADGMAVKGTFQAAGRLMAEKISASMTAVAPSGMTMETSSGMKTAAETVSKADMAAKTVAATAKSGFLHTMAGKVAAAIGICVLGGGTVLTMSGPDIGEQVIALVEQAAYEETGGDDVITEGEDAGVIADGGAVDESEEEFLPVTDDMYPSLLKGNLTREQLCFVLTGAPDSMSEEGLSMEEIASVTNFLIDRREYADIRDYGYYDDQGHCSVSDVNRLLSVITDYSYTEENNPDIVQGDVLTLTAASSSAWTEILSAEYRSDEMRIEYEHSRDPMDSDVGIIVNRRVAILRPQEDGLFQIEQISPLSDSNEPEQVSTQPWKQAYEDIIREAPNQTYQMDESIIKEPQVTYYLHDMDGDSIPELILSVCTDPWVDEWGVVSFRTPWVGVYSYKEGQGARLLDEGWYHMPVFAKSEADQSLIIYCQEDIYTPEIVYYSIRPEGDGLYMEESGRQRYSDWEDIIMLNEQWGFVDLESSETEGDTDSLSLLENY